VNFFDAAGLSGKDLAEIDFFLPRHDGIVVEGIVDVRQSLVDAPGRLINLWRTLHGQGFLRTLVVREKRTTAVSTDALRAT